MIKIVNSRFRGKFYLLLNIAFLIVSIRPAATAGPQPSQTQSTSVKMSLHVSDMRVKDVFDRIEKASRYIIFYSDDIIDVDRVVSLSVNDASVSDIMDELLKGTDNSYEISERQIIITRNEKPAAAGNQSVQLPASIRVTGKVVGNNGEELVAVTVIIKGSTRGIATNIDGTYVIDVPPGAVLVYSYLGYLPQEIEVGNKTMIDVVMQPDDRKMEEIVVVGFGRQKKESVVGAIQSVSFSDMSMPTTNLSNTFAGRVAGIISVQRTGEPGADGASFWIRGVGTFADGSAQTPLILIDGIESSSYDLNALAPEVIESFSVLKDATATALYGSRGANGVMLITTKSGADGKARINVRLEARLSTPTQVPKLADGVQYMEMFNEAILNRTPGANPQFTEEQIEGTRNNLDPYLFPNVDWYKALFKNVTHQQTANLNVSGGVRDRMNYFMSATITNESGLIKEASENPFKNNIQNVRYSLQANVNSSITRTTTVGVKLNMQVQDLTSPSNSIDALFGRVLWAPPTLYPVQFEKFEGSEYIPWGNKLGGPQANRYANPYAEMASGINETFRTTVMAAFNFDQRLDFLTEGLSVNGMYSIKNFLSTTSAKTVVPYYFEVDQTTVTQDPDSGGYLYELSPVNSDGNNAARAYSGYMGDRLLNLHATINYERGFGRHDVSTQFVYLHRTHYNNYPGDNYNASLGERYQGLAGRVTYNFDRRYFAEFNFGYNGSDSFQKGKRFGFFPSFAAGYIISNENFFEPARDIVSLLKIRGSYGEVGNTVTSERFPGYTTVNMNGRGYTFGDDFNDGKTGAIVTRYGDPNATWEVARKTNIGLELGLFRDKLLITTDVFYEKRDHILLARQTVPSTLGIGSATPYANVGKVNNRGVDLSVEYNHAIRPDFIITGRGNLTFAKNKLIYRDEPQYQWDYQYQRGGPLNRVGPGYIALGLFESQEEIDNSPDQSSLMPDVMPGDIKYADLNGDGVIDTYDRTYIGRPSIPQIVYGFGASVQYKKWDFSLFFQGVARVSIYINNIHPFGSYFQNVMGFVADSYWSESNPDPKATYPRLAHTNGYQNNQQTSTYWLRSGSFLRLKNVEVGYSFNRFRVYASGSNLLTISPFSYWDPEIGSSNGLKYPLQKIVNLGLQFNF